MEQKKYQTVYLKPGYYLWQSDTGPDIAVLWVSYSKKLDMSFYRIKYYPDRLPTFSQNKFYVYPLLPNISKYLTKINKAQIALLVLQNKLVKYETK